MTDRHPFTTHLCFVHLHLFFFFLHSSHVNFPEVHVFFPKEDNFTNSFSFRSRRCEPRVLLVSVVSMTVAFFLSSSVYICELWDLVLQPKRENRQKTIWKPWYSFANFLGELYCFKGTLVFFKNLTVLLSMCISKCLVYFFFLVLKANVFCHYYIIMTIWACLFFPKTFYDKGTSPIFCNTAATMLVNQHGLSYNPLPTPSYQEGACLSCLFV